MAREVMNILDLPDTLRERVQWVSATLGIPSVVLNGILFELPMNKAATVGA
jgi:hypothetical protein